MFAPLQYALPLRGVKVFDRSRITDWLHAVATPWTTTILLALLSATIGRVLHAFVPTSLHHAVAQLPWAVSFALSVLLAEVAAYWMHYAMHRIPFLWRFHAIHHSAEALDFLAGMRRHPVDIALSGAAMTLPSFALGFPLQNVLAFAIVYQVWTIFVHADVDIRLGVLERIVSSPFFHHGHHAKDETRPRNLASLFSFLDVLFGTYQSRADWPTAYGTTTPVDDTWVGQLLLLRATSRSSRARTRDTKSCPDDASSAPRRA